MKDLYLWMATTLAKKDDAIARNKKTLPALEASRLQHIYTEAVPLFDALTDAEVVALEDMDPSLVVELREQSAKRKIDLEAEAARDAESARIIENQRLEKIEALTGDK